MVDMLINTEKKARPLKIFNYMTKHKDFHEVFSREWDEKNENANHGSIW